MKEITLSPRLFAHEFRRSMERDMERRAFSTSHEIEAIERWAKRKIKRIAREAGEGLVLGEEAIVIPRADWARRELVWIVSREYALYPLREGEPAGSVIVARRVAVTVLVDSERFL